MLTARDEALLCALGRFRIARTSDLVHYAFPGVRKDTVARRLRTLFDSGFLDVLTSDRAAENVYFLGPAGRRWLAAHGGEVARVPRGGLAHHLAIVRCWIQIATTVETISGVRLGRFLADWELREGIGALGSMPVIPDAFIDLAHESELHEPMLWRIALEVDLGTEPLSVLGRKIAAYEGLRVNEVGVLGRRAFALALALADASAYRQSRIRGLIEDRWNGAFLLWLAAERPERALREFLRTQTHPLTDSPHGKGSRCAACHGFFESSDHIGGEP